MQKALRAASGAAPAGNGFHHTAGHESAGRILYQIVEDKHRKESQEQDAAENVVQHLAQQHVEGGDDGGLQHAKYKRD